MAGPTSKSFSDKFEWKGAGYIAEVFADTDLAGLSNIIQVQTVAITDDSQVVLFRHVDGWYGLPGGHIEERESVESALKRELREEIAAELIDYQVIGYEKIYPQNQPNRIAYLVRCVSRVELLDESEHQDPDQKSLGREVMSVNEAITKIGYGRRGPFWIQAAVGQIK